MLPPICVPCRLQMTITKNNYLVHDAEAGGFQSTYWLGDQWTCAQCGASVVAGFGQSFGPERLSREDGEALEFRYELPTDKRAPIRDEVKD